MQIIVPPMACSESEVMCFLTMFSHIPVAMQRETLKDITDQIATALVGEQKV